ncbi:MAG TPA: 2OG-Fe(II) oxygenase family protein [Croceibacterium sp.]|nr:2OG-Fe(II) oxygenase family protein [Croceibacterium sp.]
MSEIPPLALNPELDIDALAVAYRAHGRIRIQRLLGEGAPELYHHLEGTEHWIQLVNKQRGAHELPLADWHAPRSRRRTVLEREMYQRARDGFQYSYAALRVPQQGESTPDPVLAAIAELMRGPAMVAMLEAVTGIAAPRFTDGQVTSYGQGDFLTGHDDDVVGSRRQAAFVYGLTPQWRLEWGGLLLFHEPGQVEVSGLVPQFNTLDLFSVPRYHSVSQVTRAAPRRRYCVTGWLSTP